MAVVLVGVAFVVLAVVGRRMSKSNDRLKRAILRDSVGETVTMVVETPATAVKTWALDERTYVITEVQRHGVRVGPRQLADYIPLSRIREIRGADNVRLGKW